MEDKFTEALLDELEDDNAQSQLGKKEKSVEERINDCITYYTQKVNPYGFLDSGFDNETDYLTSMSRDLHDIYYVDEWLESNRDEPILCKQLEEIKGELIKRKQANMEMLENMAMEELIENMRKKFKSEREPEVTERIEKETNANGDGENDRD